MTSTHRASKSRFFLVAGPCAIESESLLMQIAETMKRNCEDLNITDYYFKASYDKANRTSRDSYRGIGMDAGLKLLEKVKKTFDLPILTDVHEVSEVKAVADVADVLQIPAFLCRQTDLIQSAAESNCIVNIKKGQFLSPYDMQHAVDKARSEVQSKHVWVTERGSCFGYNQLVVDMTALSIMKQISNCSVIFDATHSVQRPGSLGGATGGNRQFIPDLARSAVSVGLDGIFIETHPDPDQAKSDGANVWPLSKMKPLLQELLAIDDLVKSNQQTILREEYSS